MVRMQWWIRPGPRRACEIMKPSPSPASRLLTGTRTFSKRDLIDDASEVERRVASLKAVALDVEFHVVSSFTGEGLDGLRQLAADCRTIALLGASGVGKSTVVNALVGDTVQRTEAVREGDQRGRHTTTATSLVALPAEPIGSAGWLIDTPGVRAVSLWSSGHGIE
ncbi:MAG: GTPase RsgA, partial [Actinomycetota bacterium]